MVIGSSAGVLMERISTCSRRVRRSSWSSASPVRASICHILPSSAEDGKMWQIDALTGEALDQDERLTLREQVEIRSINTPADDPITIHTDWLNYHAGQQTATTDAPVVIRHPATLTEAT